MSPYATIRVSAVLSDQTLMSIMTPYMTANMPTTITMESRKRAFQTPDFRDMISHVPPMRYVTSVAMASHTPRACPERIVRRCTGFENKSSARPVACRSVKRPAEANRASRIPIQ